MIISEKRLFAPRSKISLVRKGFGPKSGSRTGVASIFISSVFTSADSALVVSATDDAGGRVSGIGGFVGSSLGKADGVL